jgi:DNA-binding Lrp family transcriptional regulator
MERKFKGIWIPKNVYLDRTLTWVEKLIFVEINSFHDDDRDCFISNETLAEFFDVTVRHVQRSLKKLKEGGWIKIVNDKVDGKRYLIPVVSDKNVAGSATKMSQFNDINVAKVAPTLNSNNKTVIKSEAPQIEIEVWPTFNDYWDSGLPKTEKERAERLWKKTRQSDREEIMKFIPLYLESTDDKQFIRGAAVFLNKKTWKDEIIDRRKAKSIISNGLGSSRTTAEETIDRLNSYSD